MDVNQALAHSRESLQNGGHRAYDCLRDLLAALDAARGKTVPEKNTSIEVLVQQYESDGCNFRDLDWVRKAAFRYVRTMGDSQVRCLLYVLAQPQPVPVPAAPPAAAVPEDVARDAARYLGRPVPRCNPGRRTEPRRIARDARSDRMKMKTTELTGTALDWAVAKACGYELLKDETLGGRIMEGWHLKGYFLNPNHWLPLASFAPSEIWQEGGPIIERESITVRHIGHSLDGQIWDAAYDEGDEVEADRPLIAAMRCYVTGKLGEEVDVPEGLIGGEA